MTYAIACLLLLAAAARRSEGSWFAPGALFCGYWSICMVAARVLASDYIVPAIGPWFVTGAALAVVIGSYLGTTTARLGSVAVASPATAIGRFRALTGIGVAGGVAGILATYMVFRQSGFSLSHLASQSGILEVGNTLAVQRYADQSQSMGTVALLLAVTYAGALASPFVLFASRAERPRWARVCMLSPAIGALAYSVVTTARLPMLLAAGFTALSSVAVVSARLGKQIKVRLSHAIAAVGVITFVAAAFVIIAFVRVGPAAGAARPVILNGMKLYAVGYVSSFSQWLDEPVIGSAGAAKPLSLGVATFGAPARQLGLDPTVSQAYKDYRQVSRNSGAGTNIYTAFRSAIEDFGVPGALAFFAILGFLAARARDLSIRTASPLATLLLVVIYAYFLNSSIQSIFWFTNVCIAILLAALCLVWSSRRVQAPPVPTLATVS
jgi:oligosaccharide repeat unit polymerase